MDHVRNRRPLQRRPWHLGVVMKTKFLLNDLALIVLGLVSAYVAGVYVLSFNSRIVIFMIVLTVLFYLPYLVQILRNRLYPVRDLDTKDQGRKPKKTMVADFLLATGGLTIVFFMSEFLVPLDAMMTSVALFLIAIRYTPHLVKSYREGRGFVRHR